MKKIKGMIAAPFTGFRADGSVDPDSVARLNKMYRDNGIAGAFICGSTGEGPALTLEEKKLLFKEWGKCNSDDFEIIAFLGGTSVKECQELALHAAACGLDGIAVTSPYYFKPATTVELCEFCRQVASAVPDMPFFYYHIPCLNGVNMPMYDLLQKMDAAIPNLSGIKYTFENMMDYQLCLNYRDRKYNIMWGRDEMLLPALAIGATVFVGSTYGYTAPLYTRIIECFERGELEEAARLQLLACRFIQLLGKYGCGCGKAFMKAIGMDLGTMRMPQRSLSEAQYAALLEDLARMPFEEYKCKII